MTEHKTFRSLYWQAFKASLVPGRSRGITVLYLGTFMGMMLWGSVGSFLGMATLVASLYFDWRKTRDVVEFLPGGFLEKLVPMEFGAEFLAGATAEDLLDEADRTLTNGTSALRRSWFIRRSVGRLAGSLLGVLTAYMASPALAADRVSWSFLVALAATVGAWLLGTHFPAFFLARKITR